MSIEDIIETLNLNIEEKRKELKITTKGHVVIQRTIETNPTFKVYKTYSGILWFIKGKKKYEIFRISQTDKVLTGEGHIIERKFENVLLNNLLNLVNSNTYQQLIEGTYETI